MGSSPDRGGSVPYSIEVATAADEWLLPALARLLPQLSSASPPDRAELEQILGSDCSTVFVATERAPSRGGGEDDPVVLGTLTLVAFRLPTGVRAWIEDVVVDCDKRGRGIGKALVGAAVEAAREAGARTVELTSRPSRQAANKLYAGLGFERRETNVYRLNL